VGPGCFYYPQDNYDEVKFGGTVETWSIRIQFSGFTREDVAMMHFTEVLIMIMAGTGKSYAAAAISCMSFTSSCASQTLLSHS
jgi:phage terminase large subunit-like protein